MTKILFNREELEKRVAEVGCQIRKDYDYKLRTQEREWEESRKRILQLEQILRENNIAYDQF